MGFALFFHNYPTFLAQPGIYLEDLFVVPGARGKGHVRALLGARAHLAVGGGCGAGRLGEREVRGVPRGVGTAVRRIRGGTASSSRR